MKRFQSIITGISAIALVAVFAAPTFAAKTVIADEELDEVTAAGQPKIAQARTHQGTAVAVNFQVNVFAAHIGGQTGLTALTVNNIFGENQIANGVNIQSGDDNVGTQNNTATQSWGSAKAWSSDIAEGGNGGNGGEVGLCLGIIAKCHAGDAAAAADKIALLWEFADEIADASVTHDGDAVAVNVVVTIVAGSFDEFAQDDLWALTGNTVFGFNQVANGLNISSGSIISGDIDAGVGSATSQANTTDQWRGSPKGWSDAPTFFYGVTGWTLFEET